MPSGLLGASQDCACISPEGSLLIIEQGAGGRKNNIGSQTMNSSRIFHFLFVLWPFPEALEAVFEILANLFH